jgi:transposase
MARFCTTPECHRYDHPLPEDAAQCPDCGSTEHRLNLNVSTHTCTECGTLNAGTHGECWACGVTLDDQTRSIDLE